MFEISAYLPILVMFIVAAGFAVSQILVTQLIGPRKRTATKLMPYECGKDPVGSARERFSIKFYNVAVMFLLFDIEVLFLIPFAVAFKSLIADEAATGISFATIALIEILIFISTLIIGLIYVWKKGVFDWAENSRNEAHAEAKALLIAKKKERQQQELKKVA